MHTTVNSPMLNTPVLIHLQENRCVEERDGFRRYQGKQPTLHMPGIDDDTLAAGFSQTSVWEQDQQILVMPVTGKMICNQVSITPGETLFLNLAAGEELVTQNPYNTELINYLLIRFSSFQEAVPELVSFEMPADRLQQIEASTLYPVASAGQFSGRKKDGWQNHSGKPIYVFVVEGVFEVEDRLLHARDGLALGSMPVIEWEALSNQAILLLLEMPF
jgi:hypothetical protein